MNGLPIVRLGDDQRLSALPFAPLPVPGSPFPVPTFPFPISDPLGSSFHQRMRRILRHHHDVALLLRQRGESGFRGRRRREAAVEQVALVAGIGDDRGGVQRQADHTRRQDHALQNRAGETQPRLATRRRPTGANGTRERVAVREPQLDRHLARERSALRQLLAHGAEERVDGEDEPLGVGERVVAPLERRVRLRPRDGREDQPVIVAAGELPQPHALGAEPHLDGLALEGRELGARLNADAVEQRGEVRAGLENGGGERA